MDTVNLVLSLIILALSVLLCVIALIELFSADHIQRRSFASLFIYHLVFFASGLGIGVCSTWLYHHNNAGAQQERVENSKNDKTKKHDIRVHAEAPRIAPTPRDPNEPPTKAKATITPEHLRSVLDSAPPNARAALAKEFSGTHISWDGRLKDISFHDDGSSALLCYSGFEDTDGPHVAFWASLGPEKRKSLVQVVVGGRIHIDGTIDIVSMPDRTCYIRNATVEPR